MTIRRPLAWINGRHQEIPVGDSLPADLIPASSGALVDGGVPSTNHTGNLKVDFGGVT